MPIKVRIPTPLQKLTGNRSEVECDGSDIKDLIENLDKSYSGIKGRLYDEKGNLRRFINIFINEKDIRFLQGDETKLRDGDEVSIIPAIAGGCVLSATAEIRSNEPRRTPSWGSVRGITRTSH